MGGANSSDNGAVSSNSVERNFNGVFFLFVLLGVFGESFSLGIHPVFVKSSHSVSVQSLGPDSRKGSKSSGGFDVSNESDNNHGRGFEDGDGFNNFFFVEFGSSSFNFSDDMGHAGFESSESGEVAWFFSIISRERPDAASVVSGSSFRGKS